MQKLFGEHGYRLVTDKAEATITFFSAHSGKRQEMTVPIITTFLESSRGNCPDI